MNFGFLCYGNKGVLNLEIPSTDTKADEVTICQGYKSLCFYCRSSSLVLQFFVVIELFGLCPLFMFVSLLSYFYGDKLRQLCFLETDRLNSLLRKILATFFF